jgi:hypothetical protein
MARLRFSIRHISDVPLSDRNEMFEIFRQYYDLPEPDSFFRDFAAKDDVIILRDKKSGAIKGFSTQKKLTHVIEGKTYKGIFSGDTIIDKEYWGDNTLGLGFIWYLCGQCDWRFGNKVYWHLISKGYKTYLLMANNFDRSYPRYGKSTPPFFQSLSDDFARQLYPSVYHKEKGLLLFEGPHEHLKNNVAPITEELKARFPHVRYFSERNPRWDIGDELVCVAEFDLWVGLTFVKKVFFKGIRRLLFPKSRSSR